MFGKAMRTRLVILSTIGVSLSATHAGVIQTTFADRIIAVSASAPPCGGEPDFQQVNNQQLDAFSIDIGFDQECALATARARAVQVSTIGPRSILGFGQSTFSAQAAEFSPIDARSTMLLMLNFNLDEPTDYTLVGVIRGQGDAPVHASAVVLSGPQGFVERFEIHGGEGDPTEIRFERTGTLPAGQNFTVMGSAMAGVTEPELLDREGSASFDFLLAMTGCLGDLNENGSVGLEDLATMLANFGATSDVAFEDGDLDSDGDVDLSDLSRLLARFGASCS